MKILTVSDLHLRRSLYEQLAAAISEHQPDLLCIVGDWLDDGGGDMSPGEAALTLAEAAGEAGVVFAPGNHDVLDRGDFEQAWRSVRPFHFLERRAKRCDGLIVVGFPCWATDDWEDWLDHLMTVCDARRTIWLMHEPPVRSLADEFFRCEAWRRAMLEHEPILIVSGHDHNRPLDTGVWRCQVGRTVCVNVGQRAHGPDAPLCYSTFRIEFGTGGPRLLDLRRHG